MADTPPTTRRRLSWPWRLLHWFIIANFAAEIAYAGWMVFAIIAPPGGGPLGERASEIPFEMMVTRRLYAIECWLAILGLAVYLAITEIAPRLRASRGA
ncbi:MAG: hypothetical protein ACQEXJ_07330 [Myxococcota bacterium]